MTVNLERLNEMAEKAAAAWPLSPQAVDRAVGYVVDGKVEFFGDLPKSGIDEWIVDGTHCSHRGQQCECRERKVSTNLGPVCSHRLAVMFQIRMDGEILDRLKAAYRDVGENVERIVLFADVYFAAGPVGGDKWLLKGWRINGVGTVNLDYADRVELTEKRLGDLLREAGWTLTGKQQQGGYTYHAYTERMDAYHARQQPEIDTGVGRLKGWSPYARERTQERERFGAMFLKALNENEPAHA